MAEKKDILKITLLDGSAQAHALVTRPDGVVYGPLRAAMSQMGEVVGAHFSDLETGDDGMFVLVPEGVDAGEIHVEERFGAAYGGRPSCSVIIAGRSSSVSVVYELSVDGVAQGAKVAARRFVAVAENARFRMEELLRGEAAARMDFVMVQARESTAAIVTVSLGMIHSAYRTDLAGSGAESTHAGLFMGSAVEKSAMDVRMNHLVADCQSDVQIKGVADGSAAGSFTGMVYVAPDAQRTQAYQQSRNLLLSDEARIETSPQLEIYADDVKCSHGATVGQLDGEAVYYMRQRGLSEEQARRLQLTGFINDIVSRIGDEGRREAILALAEDKIY